ncbi:MAG: roadblock/LC7 domain-containing protein [Candidatus Lokiarchaeota archaeon]|nr:roadblock/LC7 domain-containing protein [Candidatus Lokiarchaeota archaeon]
MISKLHEKLRSIELVEGVIGTAIIERNGLLITSRLPRDIDERKCGAMAATMYNALEMSLESLGKKKNIDHITVELGDYQIIIMGRNDKFLLLSLFESNINLGIALIEIEAIISKLKLIMED